MALSDSDRNLKEGQEKEEYVREEVNHGHGLTANNVRNQVEQRK